MTTSETSKEKTGLYIVYTPANQVINYQELWTLIFNQSSFLSKVYFILKLLFIFNTFCVEQLLSTLHASLSHSMCMCHLVMSWQIKHDLLVCMLCSCKKGIVDVKSINKKCQEVAISLQNTTCFHCCTVLQQVKAYPCKRGILDNTYSSCLISNLQPQQIQMMFSASNPNLVKSGVGNHLLQTCIPLLNIFRDPRRRNDGCYTETSFVQDSLQSK